MKKRGKTRRWSINPELYSRLELANIKRFRALEELNHYGKTRCPTCNHILYAKKIIKCKGEKKPN